MPRQGPVTGQLGGQFQHACRIDTCGRSREETALALDKRAQTLEEGAEGFIVLVRRNAAVTHITGSGPHRTVSSAAAGDSWSAGNHMTKWLIERGEDPCKIQHYQDKQHQNGPVPSHATEGCAILYNNRDTRREHCVILVNNAKPHDL